MPTQAQKRQEKPPGTSLSDVAFMARQTVKYGLIGIVVLMVGRVMLSSAISVWKSLNPPKPTPPTVGFGTLPALQFPVSPFTVDSYRLETKTGGLLSPGTEKMSVYVIPPQPVTLLSVDRATKQAASLGFSFAPEEISPTEYRWRKSSPLSSTLDIEIDTQAFKLSSDWASSPDLITRVSPSQQQQIVGNARTLLNQADLLLPDMATGSGKISFLRAVGPDLVSAPSISEAEFLRVDLFRRFIDSKYPVFRYDPNLGNASFVYGANASRGLLLIAGEYRAAPVEYVQYETYPIITPDQAWQLLQSGQGYVASVDSGVRDVVVREYSLAYFDSDEPQLFLQPIYVFRGDRNFVAYVHAITPMYVQQ